MSALGCTGIDPKAPTVGDEDDSPLHGQCPERVGRYRVLRVLGGGGMGIVYEALDPDLARPIAIKLLRPERNGTQGRLRALREAQAMARLSHPNVVPVFDVGEVEQGVFVAMERVDGMTLRAWVQRHARPRSEIVDKFLAAGRGLQAAHRAGIVHRDFKPDNVLIASDGCVKVADFGLARARHDTPCPSPSGDTPDVAMSASLTGTGGIVGTPKYMSPEQRVGEAAGPTSDQYSFCVALHEALYGRTPSHQDRVGLVRRKGRWRFEARIAGVLARGLQDEPERRFASMGQLLARLDPRSVAYRRVASVGVFSALTAGAFSGALAWNASVEGDPCELRGDVLDDVWSEVRRAELEAALDASWQDDLVTLTVSRLDRYAARWRQADGALCQAYQASEMSGPRFDATTACMALRAAALDGVLEQLEHEQALPPTELVARLPTLDCAVRSAAHPNLPDDPKQREGIARVRATVVRAEIVHHGQDVTRALELIDQARLEAAELDFGPLLSEIALVAGRLAMDRRDWSLAFEELETAWHAGVREQSEWVAAEAVARAVFVRAMESSDLGVALMLHDAASALVERVGDPPSLAALTANNVGVVYAMQGDLERARRSFARAVAMTDEDPSTNVVDRSGYLINLALHTSDPVERDAAFLDAQRLVADNLGVGHPRYDELNLRRAEYHPDPIVVRELLVPTCDRLRRSESAPGRQVHTCLYQLAEVSERLGEPEAALVAANRAAEALSKDAEAGDYAEARRAKTAAYIALLSGRHEEALGELELAHDKLVARSELPWVALDLADVALLEGRALAALGHESESLTKLRSAMPAYQANTTRSEDQFVRYRAAQAEALIDELQLRRIPNESIQR